MPAAGMLQGSLAILRPSDQSLSSCRAITGPVLFRTFSISFSLASAGYRVSPPIIRMGGGPRTFPGGVSKWQWKRMQAKKAQQLLKARLCRERQLYEMRKRAELKAAISELERPWEVVERAPVLFSASADEQVKVLADRFQRPTGFDMWSERDGPQLFLSPNDLSSARFFPKGAVHSLKPYKFVRDKLPDGGGSSDEGDGEMRYDDWIARGAGGIRRGRRAKRMLPDSSSSETIMLDPGKAGNGNTEEHPISYRSDSKHLVAGLTTEGGEMAVKFSNANGRGSASHLSESELAIPDLKLEGRDMVGSFRRRGGRRSHSVLPVSCSTVKEDKMYGRHRDSKMEEHMMPNDIDQPAGLRSRGGRNRNRGSFRSYSTLSVAGSGREDGSFGWRSGHGQNGVSQFSNAKFGVAGSKMNDGGMDESFSRRGGHGGRRGRGGFQGSYRPYSELAVNDDSTIDRGIAGNFRDRNGKHRLSREPSNSASDRSIAPSRTEGDCIAGGFVRHRVRRSRIGNRRGAISGVVGRGGGRGGGYQVSYRSVSDLVDAGSRKTREMGMDSRFGGSYQDYKGATSVPMRPTADLRLEEGGHRRRVEPTADLRLEEGGHRRRDRR